MKFNGKQEETKRISLRECAASETRKSFMSMRRMRAAGQFCGDIAR